MRRSYANGALFTALTVLWAGPGQAGDGVIEINQTSAEQTGIGPGDGPGLPVTITEPGSYRLTSNLTMLRIDESETDAIQILSHSVTLDLNGFLIQCRRIADFPCKDLGGTGNGIEISGAREVRIHNGTIRGFPQHGVEANQNGTAFVLDDLRIVENGVHGVSSRGDGTIQRCQINANGTYGVNAATHHNLVLDVGTDGNGTAGLRVGASAVAVGRSFFLDGIAEQPSQTALLITCIIDGTTSRCP